MRKILTTILTTALMFAGLGAVSAQAYTGEQIQRWCTAHPNTNACRSLGGTPGPVGVGGNWSPIFADEFSGSSLDTSKWRANWLGGSDSAVTKPINSREVSCYDPRQVTVSGGTVNLTAERRSCSSWSYASGIIQSRHDFMFTPPVFVEARVFVAGANGDCHNFPAFWTNGLNWPSTGENDIYECLSGHSDSWHYHWSGGQTGGYPPGDYVGWHTFGSYWEPDRIRWYYDGRLVGTLTSGVQDDPHYLILNNGVAPSINPAVVPSTVKADYVRVWEPA